MMDIVNGDAGLFEIELFNKVNIGVVILDIPSGDVVFENSYFRFISGEYEDVIIDNIKQHLHLRKPLSIRNDMRLAPEVYYGYTIYKLSENLYLTFLSNISYKKIYFENKEENKFYDRLSGLIAEIVHEVGNPLSAVTTTLQVLDANLESWDSGKKREYVQRAVNSLERLSKYLQLMREFSTGDEKISKKSVYLREIIDNVIGHNKLRIDFARIDLHCEVAPTIRVMLDEHLFFKIISNFVLNSLENLTGKEESSKIWIAVDEINEFYVKLLYRDNGPPIPRVEMDKMFMPFYKSEKQHAGIGLSLSRKLMIRMDGNIEVVHPPEGWGTSFIIHVPVGNE